MVQVQGVTYRVVRVADGHEIVRLLDDKRIGAFQHEPALRVIDSDVDAGTVLEVARQALHSAVVLRAPSTSSREPAQARRTVSLYQWLRFSRSSPPLVLVPR